MGVGVWWIKMEPRSNCIFLILSSFFPFHFSMILQLYPLQHDYSLYSYLENMTLLRSFIALPNMASPWPHYVMAFLSTFHNGHSFIACPQSVVEFLLYKMIAIIWEKISIIRLKYLHSFQVISLAISNDFWML